MAAERAWSSEPTAGQKAREVFGAAFGSVVGAMLLSAWADRQRSLALGHDRVRQLPPAVARMGRVLSDVQELTRDSLSLLLTPIASEYGGRPPRAVVRASPVHDLRQLYKALRQVEASLDRAREASKSLKAWGLARTKRPAQAVRPPGPGSTPVERVAFCEHLLQPDPGPLPKVDPRRRFLSRALQVARGLLGEIPRPDSPGGWAYASIAAGVRPSCSSEREFKGLVRLWKRALSNAGARPGGRRAAKLPRSPGAKRGRAPRGGRTMQS